MNEYISTICLIGIVLTFVIDYIIIKIQQHQHLGQIVRLLGPASHRSKNHTPTLGGVGFIISFIIIFIISKKLFKLEVSYMEVLFPLICYAILGLLDDLLIILKKDNEGISAILKLLIQILIAGVYFYVLLNSNNDTKVYFLNYSIELKWLYGVFILLLYTGFTNATNITDGVDGLLAGCSIICLFGLFLVSLKINYDISIVILLLMASIFGFLIWNYPKAKIFMGNIGAYCIGAIIVTIAILLKLELYLFIFGAIFILETLSVILQVSYFKITKGKRIFKMAPIHHHFELSGYKEKEVLHLFYIIEIIFVFTAIILLSFL